MNYFRHIDQQIQFHLMKVLVPGKLLRHPNKIFHLNREGEDEPDDLLLQDHQ